MFEAEYRVSGNRLMVAIPSKALGGAGEALEFGFKWCDNNLKDGDVMTLYTEGDAAPGGRFTFRFSAGKSGVEIYKKQIVIAAAVLAALITVLILALPKITAAVKRKKAAARPESSRT